MLEVFRPTDLLFNDPKPYDRAAIFAEYLGLSPSERALYANPNALTKWHELYGYASEVEALCDVRRLIATGAVACSHLGSAGNPLHGAPGLPNARVLSHRLGVSYKELVELVENAFVNPGLRDLAIPWRLDLEAVVIYLANRTKPEFAAEKQSFEERLAALDREYSKSPGFTLSKVNELSTSAAFKSTLLLRDREPSGKCNFDQTWLEFADGTPANALAFLRLNLFVRLWKTLGWTIEETGRALEVLVPRNSLPLTGANIGAALRTAIIYPSHLKRLNARLGLDTQGRVRLLTLWADIATRGKDSLYSRLFLSRSVLKNDPAFDELLGKFLSTNGILLKDHLLAVQSALTVTREDLSRILAAAKGKPFEAAPSILQTEPLTLATISVIFRYYLLARALNLSVRELIALKELSGRDPFKALDPDPLAIIEKDYPFNETLGFVEDAEEVRESGLTIEDLEYLLRHDFDEVGKYRRDGDAVIALLKTLAEGIRDVQTEDVAPDDPGAIWGTSCAGSLRWSCFPTWSSSSWR